MLRSLPALPFVAFLFAVSVLALALDQCAQLPVSLTADRGEVRGSEDKGQGERSVHAADRVVAARQNVVDIGGERSSEGGRR